MVNAREDEFMEKLIALSKEYGIAIGACGCCDSPWLISLGDTDDTQSIPSRTQLGLDEKPLPEFKM